MCRLSIEFLRLLINSLALPRKSVFEVSKANRDPRQGEIDCCLRYCKHFAVNPPSRLCVAVALPPGDSRRSYSYRMLTGVLASLECFGVDQTTTTRQTLHVQSISRWAPTCIGPYSQVSSESCLIRKSFDIYPLDGPLCVISLAILTPPQATSLHSARVVHIAGQLGQHPPTMMLIDPFSPERQVN